MPLPHPSRAVSAALAACVTALLAACAPEAAAGPAGPPRTAGTLATATASAAAPATVAAPVTAPADRAAAQPTRTAAQEPSPDAAARPPESRLSIPAAGVEGLRVVPYEGTTDDAPGTRIQDLGVAASPYGKRGGVGPGQVGNFLVTAHRLSAGGPLRDLPALKEGDEVRVTAGAEVYTYEIVATRETSFRSERSLSEQRAAVPGEPGATPARAMITLSTCATPEDHAEGNYWSDAQGNPEHRIDKIGVLRKTSAATPTPAPAPAG